MTNEIVKGKSTVYYHANIYHQSLTIIPTVDCAWDESECTIQLS